MQLAMEQRLQRSTLANSEMLSYRHLTQYHRPSGFQVAVDGAAALRLGKHPAFALHSVAPPAPFYTLHGRSRIAGDVHLTRQLDIRRWRRWSARAAR